MSAPTPSRSTADGVGDDGNYASESKTDIEQRHGNSENSKMDFGLQQDVRVAITPTGRNTNRPNSNTTPFQGDELSANRTNMRQSLGFTAAAGVKPADVLHRSVSAFSQDRQTFPGVTAADDAVGSANVTKRGECDGVCVCRH